MHPILFKLGPLTFYSYGLMLAIGFFVSTSLAARYARCIGTKITQDQLTNLCFFSFFAGIAGARTLYLLMNLDYYSVNPHEIIRLDHGGLIWYGGLVAGVITASLYLRFHKLPFWEVGDTIAPFLALAHAFGRIGCFLNGCCFGKPTHSIFGMYFPNRLISIHPTQLYSAVGLFSIFFFLLLWRRWQKFTGEIILVYGFSYAAGRFGIEFLRGDNRPIWLGLTLSQFLSIPLAILCLTLWVRKRVSA